MNFTRLETCFATGANLAVRLQQKGIDLLSQRALVEKGEPHLGPGADFWQRVAFDWGYLSIVCGPDDENCKTALAWVKEAREREARERGEL